MYKDQIFNNWYIKVHIIPHFHNLMKFINALQLILRKK